MKGEVVDGITRSANFKRLSMSKLDIMVFMSTIQSPSMTRNKANKMFDVQITRIAMKSN